MKMKWIGIVFILLLGLCSGMTLASFFDETDRSEKENRMLQPLPSLGMENYLNGSYFKNLEAYVYDHFPGRNKILNYAENYERIKGIQPKVMALKSNNNMNMTNGKEAGQSALPRKKLDPKKFTAFKTQTQNLEIMVEEDTLLGLFHFDENCISNYADAANQYASNLPKDIKLYAILVPTQIGLKGDRYADFSDPQDKAITYLYSLLDKRYHSIDVWKPLYKNREEYLYFRSDHHWTQLGAYYAAQAFAEEAGLEFIPLQAYTKHSFEGFLGYLYNGNQVESVAAHPDRIDAYIYGEESPLIKFFYYKEGGNHLSVGQSRLVNLTMSAEKPSYGMFLGGDYPIIKYENPSPKSNRRLLIVKDSFANAFVPWLAVSYDKIIVVDPRFFKEDLYELAKQEKITDFVVLNNIKAATLKGYIEFMHEIGKSENRAS